MIAGVDGCRAGWVVASTPGPAQPITVEVVPNLGGVALLLRDSRLTAVGIDIPIGLPAYGARACDLELRRTLGRRGSSVFPAPVRALLELPNLDDYRAARDLSLATHGRSLSIQSFNLLPKIAEVDALIEPDTADRITEVHPESAFRAMAGSPLAHSKTTAAGRAERRALIARALPEWGDRAVPRLAGAAADDILDALAALWSTARWQAGEARVFGGTAVDPAGRRMQIVV